MNKFFSILPFAVLSLTACSPDTSGDIKSNSTKTIASDKPRWCSNNRGLKKPVEFESIKENKAEVRRNRKEIPEDLMDWLNTDFTDKHDRLVYHHTNTVSGTPEYNLLLRDSGFPELHARAVALQTCLQDMLHEVDLMTANPSEMLKQCEIKLCLDRESASHLN